MSGMLRWLMRSVRPDAPPDERRVQAPGCDGVIFPAEEGFHCDGLRPTYWTPTREQVLEAEGRIAAYLQEAAPAIAAKLTGYRRQYVGMLFEHGRFIYMNFFRLDPRDGDRWLTEPVVVDDGGDDYFQVQYDVSTGDFCHLCINGEA
jgi:hypothetical protein